MRGRTCHEVQVSERTHHSSIDRTSYTSAVGWVAAQDSPVRKYRCWSAAAASATHTLPISNAEARRSQTRPSTLIPSPSRAHSVCGDAVGEGSGGTGCGSGGGGVGLDALSL